MTHPRPYRWSIQAVDARLARLDRELDELAAQLDLPVQEVEQFARVRKVLLAGRTSSGETGTDLDEADLVAAGITVKDILAYQQVGLRILERSRNERADRTGSIHTDAVPYGLPGRDTNDEPAGEEGR
jgi:hypothetical protein